MICFIGILHPDLKFVIMFWQDHQEKIEDETDSSKNRKKNEDTVINQHNICGLSAWSYSYLLIRDDCLDALDVCILLMS